MRVMMSMQMMRVMMSMQMKGVMMNLVTFILAQTHACSCPLTDVASTCDDDDKDDELR